MKQETVETHVRTYYLLMLCLWYHPGNIGSEYKPLVPHENSYKHPMANSLHFLHYYNPDQYKVCQKCYSFHVKIKYWYYHIQIWGQLNHGLCISKLKFQRQTWHDKPPHPKLNVMFIMFIDRHIWLSDVFWSLPTLHSVIQLDTFSFILMNLACLYCVR